MQSNSIFQYLTSKGFNLSNDRIFREQNPPYDIIWSILVFLCQDLKNDHFKQLLPTLSHILEPEVHQNSTKRLEQYITVSKIMKKLQLDYPYEIDDLIHPQRQKITEKISCLIQVCKYREKLLKDYDQRKIEIKKMGMTIKEINMNMEEVCEQADLCQKEKESQKDVFEEKKTCLDQILNETTYKKREKSDLMASEEMLNVEKTKKQNVREARELTIKQKQTEIQKLDEMVIENGPVLKKQKIQFIENLEKLKKQLKAQELEAEKRINEFNLEGQQLGEFDDENKDLLEQISENLKESENHKKQIEEEKERIKKMNEQSSQLTMSHQQSYNSQTSLEVNINQAVSKTKLESDKVKEQKQRNQAMEQQLATQLEMNKKLESKFEQVANKIEEETKKIKDTIEELKRQGDIIEEQALKEFKES